MLRLGRVGKGARLARNTRCATTRGGPRLASHASSCLGVWRKPRAVWRRGLEERERERVKERGGREVGEGRGGETGRRARETIKTASSYSQVAGCKSLSREQ